MVKYTGTEAVQPRDAHIFIAPAVVQRAVPELICAGSELAGQTLSVEVSSRLLSAPACQRA